MMRALALGWDRTSLELKMYLRERESVLFSFLFPILMLTLFSVIFGGQVDDPELVAQDMTAARLFLPGMVSAGVLLTSFQTLALSVAIERDDGTLKRLRSTPMPRSSYFLGKIGLVAASSAAQMVLLLLVARFAFSVALPGDAASWVTFAWVFGLGVAGGTVLGIAYSSLATSARAAGAVVVGPLLVLQFISGVYVQFRDIPEWLQQVASLLPLKWVAQGMRAVFYPDSWQVNEMAGAWELGRVALVLLVWFVLGFLLCVTTFRWYKRGTV